LNEVWTGGGSVTRLSWIRAELVSGSNYKMGVSLEFHRLLAALGAEMAR
jgi:hypothetical protein